MELQQKRWSQITQLKLSGGTFAYRARIPAFQIPALEKLKNIVNRIRNMVSFELGKEIERDVFRLVTSVPQRKKL